LVNFIRKTVNIHPSIDKIIRLVQIRFLKIGYDYDYSSALNNVVAATMFLGLARGDPDAQIVRNVRRFAATMETEEISEEILERYEEYLRKIDLLLKSDKDSNV